ncbi:MAG: hypothetical protein BWZ02_00666 [Lentisphaerae bacterium ADurb.BinA184]|nr:MAG: hypothetical protein BWZ02_00666 [Lentisphaerae bacterium ADurb.BinA184]
MQTSPLVHHLTVQGRYNQAVPTYDLTVTNSAAATFSATGLSWFFGGAPTVGEGVDSIQFHTFLSAGDYLIDGVSLIDVPEPASVLPLAGALFLLRRRHDR